LCGNFIWKACIVLTSLKNKNLSICERFYVLQSFHCSLISSIVSLCQLGSPQFCLMWNHGTMRLTWPSWRKLWEASRWRAFCGVLVCRYALRCTFYFCVNITCVV
jgi:hypothetical protein